MIYILNLQQFADDSGDASQAAAGDTGARTEQAAAAGETKVSFDELINGDYREDYQKSVQKVVRQRFAKAKADEDKLAKLGPVVSALASKYGVDPEDLDSIAKYVDEDDSMYEDAAYEAGMSVDQYKRYSQIEAENRRMRAERQANENRRMAEAQLARWNEEAEEIKASFPNFDLDTYLADSNFQNLLRSGVSLKQAYIALDADNILPEVMGYAAQQAGKKTAATIAQRGSRPVEGGMSGRASAKATTDVSKLTNEEIADIVRRANQGEIISFS